jgi:hypothetical protein
MRKKFYLTNYKLLNTLERDLLKIHKLHLATKLFFYPMALNPKQKKKAYIIIGSVAGSLILLMLIIIIYMWRSNLSHRRFVYSALTKGVDWKANLSIDPPAYPSASTPADSAKVFKYDEPPKGIVRTMFFRVNKNSKETPIIFLGNDTEGIPLSDEYGHDFLEPIGPPGNFLLNFDALSKRLIPQGIQKFSSLGTGISGRVLPYEPFRTVTDKTYLASHANIIYLLDPKLTFGHTTTSSGDVVLYEYWLNTSNIFSSVKDLPKCVVAYVYCKNEGVGRVKYSDIFWWSVTDVCTKKEQDICELNHVVVRKAFNNPKDFSWHG